MNWKETVKKYEGVPSLSDKQKEVFGILEHLDYGEIRNAPADEYDETYYDAVSRVKDEHLLDVIIELYSHYPK